MSQITALPEAASLFVLGLGLIIVALLLRRKFSKPQGKVGAENLSIPNKSDRK
jgi:hypothetical protein